MAFLKEQMQVLVHQLSSHAPSAPSVQQPVSPQGPIRGRAALSEVPSLAQCVTQKVPGDGDCLWHACASWSVAGSAAPQDSEVGKQYKQHILQRVRGQPHSFAAAWGCQIDAIESTCAAWEADWADARAVLSIALVEQAFVVIINRSENLIEVIGPHHHEGDGRVRCWVLEFLGDHYNPVTPPSEHWPGPSAYPCGPLESADDGPRDAEGRC